MNSIKLNITGFEAYIEELKKLGANVEKETEKALLESAEILTNELHVEMQKHIGEGRPVHTESSLREPKVKWNGKKASVKVGFNIKKGGEPAIYLEYGRLHNRQKPTPVLKPAEDRSKEIIKQRFEKIIENARKG